VSEWTQVRWEDLPSYPMEEAPADHPWPSETAPDLRVYSAPLKCEHHVFTVSRYAPGDSIEHHRHEIAEEIYVLLSGGGQIRIGDDVIEASPLDAFRVPAELLRSVYNHTEQEAVWLVIGAPEDEFGYLSNP
jgi:mannose-6-phosphate isomerase-like protein (cupin superfamily)